MKAAEQRIRELEAEVARLNAKSRYLDEMGWRAVNLDSGLVDKRGTRSEVEEYASRHRFHNLRLERY